jgi:deoxyribodipyrimidine photo-lyase
MKPGGENMELANYAGRITGLPPLEGARPKFVVYWMQQSQRVDGNHALSFATELAAEWDVPLYVLFVLSGEVPEANLRHYRFMIEGLAETIGRLAGYGLPLYLAAGSPSEAMAAAAGKEGFVVTDKGYLNWQRKWRQELYGKLGPGRWIEVESDVAVPVELVSDKEEYAAATIRRKLLKKLEYFLMPTPVPLSLPKRLTRAAFPADVPHRRHFGSADVEHLLEFARERVSLGQDLSPSGYYTGGYAEAIRRVDDFIEGKIGLYAEKRNDPSLDIQSGLSPYLHLGQISPLEVAMRALGHFSVPGYAVSGLILNKTGLSGELAGLASFLEELIVRRELACNFCYYNPVYDRYGCLPSWARTALNDHILDPRPSIYTPEELEEAGTDDPYWNAAQKEMVLTGKMHNYMRMYWGKKLIEWTPDPESAFHLAAYLNNKYQLDGRDPNSFAGIAWCFGKHDRPWQPRSVFGSVRYMNAAGLKRKFNMQGYLDRISGLS